jgi:hypothetical protein
MVEQHRAPQQQSPAPERTASEPSLRSSVADVELSMAMQTPSLLDRVNSVMFAPKEYADENAYTDRGSVAQTHRSAVDHAGLNDVYHSARVRAQRDVGQEGDFRNEAPELLIRRVEKTVKQQHSGQEEALLRRIPNDVRMQAQRVTAQDDTKDDYRALVLGSEPGLRDDALLDRVRTTSFRKQRQWSPQTPVQQRGADNAYSDDLLWRTNPEAYAEMHSEQNTDVSLMKRVTKTSVGTARSLEAFNEGYSGGEMEIKPYDSPSSTGITHGDVESRVDAYQPHPQERMSAQHSLLNPPVPEDRLARSTTHDSSRQTTRRSTEENGEAMLARASQLMGLDPSPRTLRPPPGGRERRWLQ